MKPTIYLDIYDVILGDGQQLSPGARELIIYAIEYLTLRRHDASDSLIKINLHEHPDQLLQALERLRTYV